jgi:hypothetical protein
MSGAVLLASGAFSVIDGSRRGYVASAGMGARV